MKQVDIFRISLAAVRVNANQSQAEWARTLGVSKASVGNYETGRCEPPYTVIRKMSEVSGIPIDCIFVPSKS